MKNITKEQEYFLYRFTRGTWMLNTESGLVDVIGTFNCSGQNLPDFLGIEFGKIKNDFNCSHNKLVSLEGAPQEVGGYFNCSNNQLISLDGAPKNIKYSFYCYNNKLVSLEGAPQKVGWDLTCDAITLRGCPSNLLKRIYFSKDIGKVSLINVIRNIDDINRLYLEIYLKKMV